MDYINLNAFSYHVSRARVAEYNLREVNPGIGFERNSGGDVLMVGEYENSVGRTSVYLLKGKKYSITNTVKIGAVVGGITGYRLKVAPAFAFIGAWEYKAVGVNVLFVPPAEKFNVFGFWGLQFKVKL